MPADDTPEEIATLARAQGRSIAVAESLTGGLLTARFAAAPKASEWFRGGVVAYNAEVKRDVLGVPAGLVVNEQTATTMALGVARLFGADLTVSTTGVGGPTEEEGQAPGTVWIAMSWDGRPAGAWLYRFDGDPPEICQQTCEAALLRVRDRLAPVERRSAG
ncbi:MAG TPA: CinA family protein [Sporichthya sp.]|nr:CinA family protein [Sporichthya sp.]